MNPKIYPSLRKACIFFQKKGIWQVTFKALGHAKPGQDRTWGPDKPSNLGRKYIIWSSSPLLPQYYSNWIISPSRDEKIKYLKPPPSCCLLDSSTKLWSHFFMTRTVPTPWCSPKECGVFSFNVYQNLFSGSSPHYIEPLRLRSACIPWVVFFTSQYCQPAGTIIACSWYPSPSTTDYPLSWLVNLTPPPPRNKGLIAGLMKGNQWLITL